MSITEQVFKIPLPSKEETELTNEEKLAYLWESERMHINRIYQNAIYKVEKYKKKLREAKDDVQYAKEELKILNSYLKKEY